MKTSDKGIAFLAANEGVVPGPYLDSVNVWTWGVGHTAAAGDPIPKSMPRGMPADVQAELAKVFAVFRNDLAVYEAAVNDAVAGIPNMTQYQFDAAVSFHYNTGAIGSATWVKTWRSGNLDLAAAQIMNWRTPSSIIPRREAEQTLWDTGDYGSCIATVWPVKANGQVIWTPYDTLTQSEMIALMDADVSPSRPLLKLGDKGDDVRDLQMLLAARGLYRWDVDGDFGGRTDATVRYFQALEGLTIDGKAWTQVWTALGV